MKFFTSIMTLLIGFSTSAALADSKGTSSLKATDGTQINIQWQSNYSFDSGSGLGVSKASFLSVEVKNARLAGSQAVILNNCSSPSGENQNDIYKCDLILKNGISECTVATPFLIRQDIAGGASSAMACSQQIAIVLSDNTWLVDPVSGQHNFSFQMN